MGSERADDVAAGWAADFADQRRQLRAWLKEWRKSLTDDECREGLCEYERLRKKKLPVPEDIKQKTYEYQYRYKRGIIAPLTREERERRRQLRMPHAEWWAQASDEDTREACREERRLKRRGLPIPEEVSAGVREYSRRAVNGSLVRLDPQEVIRRRLNSPENPHRIYRPTETSAAWTDDELRAAKTAERELYRRGLPVAPDIRAKVSELRYRRAVGRTAPLTREERAARSAAGLRAAAARRAELLPPPAELRERRIALGLTLEDLGRKLGVTASAVSGWELGKGAPFSAGMITILLAVLEPADLANPELTPWERKRAERRSSMPAPAVLKERRETRGLTRDELATELGLSEASIEQWENGRAIPGPTNYDRYLEALGLKEGSREVR